MIMREASKFVVLRLLEAYKWAISPLFPPACRYVPTCSEYAMEAVERYGAVRGGLMAFWRLLRCHPLTRGGYDPVVKAVADNIWNGTRKLWPNIKILSSNPAATVSCFWFFSSPSFSCWRRSRC